MMASRVTLEVCKLSEKATIPTRGSALAAGYDLYAAYSAVVPAKGKALVKTDVAVKCPPGTYGRIAPRSGLAWKNFLDVGAGVVDADYRGNVGVILFNHADEDFKVEPGDRIAQFILEKILMAPIVEVEKLEETERGAGGFGSTGVSGGTPMEPELKKPKTAEPASDNQMAMQDLLVALGENAEAFTAEQKTALKKKILGGDDAVIAVGLAHQKLQNKEELIDNLKHLL